MNFDWADLAFGSKRAVNDLNGVFIAAPRELSTQRFLQLVKTYLPKGNIVLGLAKEQYVAGFNEQPQFRMLNILSIQDMINKVNGSGAKFKIYTLEYFQRETKYVLEKLNFQKIVLVNGSWKYSYHTQEPYYVLAKRKIDYNMVSPFASEAEARTYALTTDKAIARKLKLPKLGTKLTEQQIMDLVESVAKQSYDYSFQAGAVLAKKAGNAYMLIETSFNKVVPYQSYALHHGALREQNFSPPNDLNFYDTVHAEVLMLIKAQEQKIDLAGTTLFINLLPCPHCSRILSQTKLTEVVYTHDHSSGYALDVFEQAGKKVRRATKV